MAEKRKKRMPYHVEYCRKPEYRAKKRDYDQGYRAEKTYGPFAEAFLASMSLRHAVKDRATSYEIRIENGTFGKSQKRKRDGSANR